MKKIITALLLLIVVACKKNNKQPDPEPETPPVAVQPVTPADTFKRVSKKYRVFATTASGDCSISVLLNDEKAGASWDSTYNYSFKSPDKYDAVRFTKKRYLHCVYHGHGGNFIVYINDKKVASFIDTNYCYATIDLYNLPK